MLPLFTSCICERCDGPPRGRFYVGFVVWRGGDDGDGPRQDYVFRTGSDARRWRDVNKLTGCEIRPVLVEHEPGWHLSRGTIKGLELADRLFEVYPNHRFPPAHNRAFLAPESVDPRDQGYIELS